MYNYNFQTENLQPLAISWPSNPKIASMAIFNGRLYFLDVNNKQIWRYIISGEDFGQPSPWINDETVDLTQAVDFAIDGLIYVLNKSGGITLLTQGKKSEFNVSLVDPLIVNAAKIKTGGETKFIYVLETNNRRIIVFDKFGKLVSQYQLPYIGTMKDFIVLEKEKKIFILIDDAIYGIPLNE